MLQRFCIAKILFCGDENALETRTTAHIWHSLQTLQASGPRIHALSTFVAHDTRHITQALKQTRHVKKYSQKILKVKHMSKSTRKTVLIFLDTDKHTSPFDVLTAIDLYPDAQILPYSNVEPNDAKRIIQDAMFPRGPKGAKHTKIFIGGQDVEKAIEILKIAKTSMFPPFELAVIVDPRGAYTTASAAVAKSLALFSEKGFGGFKGKNVTVLAGTGPVGQVAARLYSKEGGNVIVTSRKLQRATAVADKINEELGVERACGAQASAPDEIGQAIKQSDIILSAGAAGIQLLPIKVLKDYSINVSNDPASLSVFF